jgi:hypothetical protein
VPDKRSDIEIVRDQITAEVTADAEAVADDVFRRDGPDLTTVSNQDIDTRYARAFAEGDRKWLQLEARRNPRQFLSVTKRLGVKLPPPGLAAQPGLLGAPPQIPLPPVAPQPVVSAPVPPPPVAPLVGSGAPPAVAPGAAPPMVV